MYKKILIGMFGVIAAVTNVAMAGEYTGDINTGIDTGIGGVVIKSPTASPGAGDYTSAVSVSLSAEGSVYICYTTNSSTPTCNWDSLSCSNGTRYSSAITFTSTTTLKAVSCYRGGDYSGTSTYKYTITSSGGGGGGGGGGGSSPGTCMRSNLECRNGVYYRKTGASCNGGDLGKACTITDGGGTQSDGYKNDIWLDNIRNNAYALANDKQKVLIDKILELFKSEINIDLELAKFQDDVRVAKNNYLRLFNDILVNILNYVNTKDSSYKNKALELIGELTLSKNNLLNAKLKYVKIVNGIYRPIDEKYGKIFQQIEEILFKKIDSLNLSEDAYNEFLTAYNNFVFSVLIYKIEKSDEARKFAGEQIETILKYYYMN